MVFKAAMQLLASDACSLKLGDVSHVEICTWVNHIAAENTFGGPIDIAGNRKARQNLRCLAMRKCLWGLDMGNDESFTSDSISVQIPNQREHDVPPPMLPRLSAWGT